MAGNRLKGVSALIAMSVCGLAAVLPASGVAASARLSVGSAAPLPSTARVVGKLAGSTPLRLTVALEPRDPVALESFATAVSEPGSPDFRHYISVAQFAGAFGATPAAISAVESSLRGAGLRVGSVSANDLMIPARGTASQIENAMSVSISQVRLASGRRAYANLTAPTLPASISRYVQGVIGLDDLTPPQPAGVEQLHKASALRASTMAQARASGSSANVVTGGPQPCSAATNVATNAGYTADILASAYQFSSLYQAGDKGAGQTVALVEEIPYDPADIGVYAGCYGVNAAVTPVNVDGGPGPFTPGVSDDGESALDIETVIGLAPSANILVYQGPEATNSPADILNAIVSQNLAKVISTSFGVCEAATGGSVILSENTLLQEAAAQGQSFFSASGDSGAETCSQLGKGDFSLSVEDPAAQPFATGVGGTTMFSVSNGQAMLDTTGAPPSESVWNNGPNPKCNCTNATDGGGSGGGISSQWPMPSYQSGAASSLGVVGPNSSGKPCGSSECRQVPDVSADADDKTGYAVYTNGQWGVVGGTSAASPLWASFTALINAQPSCRGLTIGFANPALYEIGGTSYLNNFHDVGTIASPITGATSNDTLDQFGVGNSDPSFLYPQGTGYDMSTGIGTPIGSTLASTLCSVRSPVYTVTVASPGSQLSVLGRGVALQVHASDSGGAALGYVASGLPAGLAINPSTGVISGTPTATGTSTATVSATDAVKNSGATQFSWTIVKPGPPSASHASFGGLEKRKAKLKFTIAAGANAPAIKSLTISLPSGLKFAKSSKSLSKGITIKGSNGKKVKFKAKVSHGKLTITLSSPVTKATVTIAKPAVTVSGKLATKVRKHKVKKLKVGLSVVDASSTATRLPLKLRV